VKTILHDVRPRKDKRGVDLISDALPFGRLRYDTPDNAIGYAMHSSRLHDAVIRVYDAGFVTSRRLEPQCEGHHPQRAGIAGIAWFAFISSPAAFVGGVPLTRAMIPWAMPEPST